MSCEPRCILFAAAFLAAFLAAVPASAGPAELNAALGESAFLRSAAAPAVDFSPLQSIPQRPPAGAAFAAAPDAYGAPLASVPLAPLLDGIRATKAQFRAGSSWVHVFAVRDENKRKWFVGFAPDDGPTQLFNGRELIHWGFISHTVHFTAGGRRFIAYIEAVLSDKMSSRLYVEPEDRSAPASSWTAAQVLAAGYDVGYPVSIAGSEYRLLYARDFDENESGAFSGYTGDRTIHLLTRVGDRIVGYEWRERDIPGDRILVSTRKADGAAKDHPLTLTLGLRLNAGSLEFYAPGSAPN